MHDASIMYKEIVVNTLFAKIRTYNLYTENR